MFTGIIQHKVRILSRNNTRRGMDLTVENPLMSASFSTGESISINGICLTLEKQDSRSLSFFAQCETVEKTTLRQLKIRELVNFERALALSDRMGGHIVLGHVDGISRIQRKERKGDSIRYELLFPENVRNYLIPKGSVAVDGISLTLSSLSSRFFTLDIIPSTYESTNIKTSWRVGAFANIEADMISKQVHRSVESLLFQKKTQPLL